MNNLKLYENTILVKADKKTQEYLLDWSKEKKEEWISRQKKLNIEVDTQDIEARELKGEVLPYEKALIPQYEEIKLEFREALEDHGAGIYAEADIVTDNKEKGAEGDVSITSTKGYDKTA